MGPSGEDRQNEDRTRGDLADRQRALGFGAIGLAQGLIFVVCHELWPEAGGASVARALVPSLAAGVAGLCLQFTWTEAPRRRWVSVAAVTACVFALPALWVFLQFEPDNSQFGGDRNRAVSLWPAAGIALYVLGPYLQLYVESGSLRFPYPRLFFHAWNNALVAVFGLFYAGVFSVLALLCRGLFSVLGIEIVESVTSSPRFWLLLLPVMFGFGVATGSASVRLIDALRATLLAVFRFLIPLYALISLAFLLTLPFVGLKPVWDTGYASFLLLSTVILGVLFLNAVLEDGSRSVGIPRTVRGLVAAAMLGLPIFAALALYSLWLRIDQHGLSPQRIFGAVVALVLAMYASSYAVAIVRRRGEWMATIAPSNIALSLVVIALAFALHSPLLDPLSLSVRNQVSRLLSGRVSADDFDFANLRYDLGRRGYAALQQLSQGEGEGAARAIRVAAVEALAIVDRSGTPVPTRRISANDFEPVAGLGRVPEGFVSAVVRDVDEYALHSCRSPQRCAVFALDLVGAGTPATCVVVSFSSRAECFEQRDDAWHWLGQLQPAPNDNRCGPGCDLHALLRQGAPAAIAPLYRDVRIGRDRFELRPRD